MKHSMKQLMIAPPFPCLRRFCFFEEARNLQGSHLTSWNGQLFRRHFSDQLGGVHVFYRQFGLVYRASKLFTSVISRVHSSIVSAPVSNTAAFTECSQTSYK